MSSDRLIEELHELSRTLDLPEPDLDALTTAILDRVAEPSGPGLVSTLKRRWRAAIVALAALLLALALTPPVRAAVSEWFGIVVQSGEPVEERPVPHVRSGLTLAEARQHIDFEPLLPEALGTPEGVEVSADERVLSMSWTTAAGTVRLDEFQGEVAPGFVKRTHDDFEFIDLGRGRTGLWFGEPHEVLPLDEAGREQVELARSSGPTLVWPVGEVTLRLEGLARDDAITLARSTLGTE